MGYFINREHFAVLQKSNSAAANSISDTILGRAGFKIVIDKMQGRASGGTNVRCLINASDAFQSSFNVGETLNGATTGLTVQATYEGPHSFGEGKDVVVTAQGDGTAVAAGYTLDYHYEPAVLGASG